MRAFVSYTRADQKIVLEVVDVLECLGLRVWIDVAMQKGGEPIKSDLANGIAAADVFVIGLSPASVDAHWVREELAIADSLASQPGRGRPMILPLTIGLAQNDFPPTLAGLVYIDLRSPTWRERLADWVDDAFPELRREVLRIRHTGPVRDVAFSSDGVSVASASDDCTAQIWHVGENCQLAEFRHDGGRRAQRGLLAVAFDPHGTMIATAGRDKTARIREVARTAQELLVVRHPCWVRGVSFRHDGAELATAGEDGRARGWSVPAGTSELVTRRGRRLNAVAYSPDARYLATARDDGAVRVWDLRSNGPLLDVIHGDVASDVAFHPDGEQIATVSRDGSARVTNIHDGSRRELETHGTPLWAVAFSPDGNRLATAGEDRSARVWDLATRSVVQRVGHEDIVWAVAFGPGGTMLATASADFTARVWTV